MGESGHGLSLKFMRKSKKNELQTKDSEPVSQHGSPLRMKPASYLRLRPAWLSAAQPAYQQAIPQGNSHRVQRAGCCHKTLVPQSSHTGKAAFPK